MTLQLHNVTARLLLVAGASLLLAACMPYTIASGLSSVTTGKSLTEHALSKATGGDCSTYDFVVHNDTHSYYCEMPRTAANTYVRDPY
jgi:hypothetical protein